MGNIFAVKVTLVDSLLYAAIGLIIVFAALFIIIGFLYLMQAAFKLMFKEKAAVLPKADPVFTEEAEGDAEEETAAVIAAVIAIVTQETGLPRASFRIADIKRTR